MKRANAGGKTGTCRKSPKVDGKVEGNGAIPRSAAPISVTPAQSTPSYRRSPCRGMSSSDEIECIELDSSSEFEDSFENNDAEDDFYPFLFIECTKSPHLMRDVQMACRNLRHVEDIVGQQAVEICDDSGDGGRPDFMFCSVRICLPINTLSDRTKEVWHIKEDVFLVIEFSSISKNLFRMARELPSVKVRHHFSNTSNQSFPIGKQIENITSRFVEDGYRVNDEGSMNVTVNGSFFERLHRLISGRLGNLTDFCVNCDERLPSGGILPSICKREFCVFQYDEIGLYHDIAGLAITADVLDLLVTLFMDAVCASDVELMLNPWPLIRDPHDETLLVFGCNPRSEIVVCREDFKAAADQKALKREGPEQGKNDGDTASPPGLEENYVDWVACRTPVTRMKHHLRRLPSAQELTDPTFFGKLRRENLLQAKLVTWLIASNRAYLFRLPKSHQIDMMRTSFQYLTVADSPAKQEKFLELKRANRGKSVFVFHGSPMQNWHSILRNGLIVASGTNLMRNGSAYGKGIYFSPNMNVSLTYSSSHAENYMVSSLNNKFSASVCNIALSICEIVDDDRVLVKNGGSDIWVLRDSNYCCVRLLFLFEDTSLKQTSRSRSNERLLINEQTVQQIQRAMAFFSNSDFNARVDAFTHLDDDFEDGPSTSAGHRRERDE